MRALAAGIGLLLLAGCAGGAGRAVQCVPYARARSGLPLYGDAASWWQQAAGRFRRGHAPQPGAVLVFRATSRLPAGHVATVVRLRSEREILVDHANWVPGQIGRADPVLDVSPGHDWTAVRVWWAPAGRLGASTYATAGFVLPEPAMDGPMAQAGAAAP